MNKKTWFLALMLLLLACVKDDFSKLKTPEWEPEIALALIDSRFDVSRVLQKANESGSIIAGDDNVVTIVYNGSLFKLAAGDVLSFEDIDFNLLLAKGTLGFPVPGKSIKHMQLENGKLFVDIEHNLTTDVVVELTIPTATKNGQGFVQSIPMNYGGSVPVRFTGEFDLSGYDFDMTGNDGLQSNIVEIDYTAKRVENGAQVSLSQFDISFRDLLFKYIDGYFGEIDLGSIRDSFQMDLFQNFVSGTILLENPQLDLIFNNSFGIPITASINRFTSKGKGNTLNLSGQLVNAPFEVLGSKDNVNGSPETSVISMNSGNSNLRNFISFSPSKFDFEFELSANKDSDPSDLNFLFSDSELEGLIDLKIPLSGSLDSVMIQDVYEFDTKDLESASSASFKIWTENMFPLGIFFQVYFLNGNNQTIDSLLIDNNIIFKSAISNADGFSVSPSIEESLIEVGAGRFKKIKDQAKRFKVQAMLLSEESKTKAIKISATDYFHFKLGITSKLKYTE